MQIASSTEKEAPKKNKQLWLQSANDRARKVPIGCIVFGLIGCLLCPLFNEAALGFMKNECVTHLTTEVDPQFRLSPAQAAARCDEISARIAKLTKQIIGKWQRKAPKGKIETMEVLADGTAIIHQYNDNKRKMEDVVQKWAIENPYGTPGEESLSFDEGHLSSVKFSGATMTITSQPASALIVERWTRVK